MDIVRDDEIADKHRISPPERDRCGKVRRRWNSHTFVPHRPPNVVAAARRPCVRVAVDALGLPEVDRFAMPGHVAVRKPRSDVKRHFLKRARREAVHRDDDAPPLPWRKGKCLCMTGVGIPAQPCLYLDFAFRVRPVLDVCAYGRHIPNKSRLDGMYADLDTRFALCRHALRILRKPPRHSSAPTPHLRIRPDDIDGRLGKRQPERSTSTRNIPLVAHHVRHDDSLLPDWNLGFATLAAVVPKDDYVVVVRICIAVSERTRPPYPFQAGCWTLPVDKPRRGRKTSRHRSWRRETGTVPPALKFKVEEEAVVAVLVESVVVAEVNAVECEVLLEALA